MESVDELLQFDELVRRVFIIEDRTLGNPEKNYTIRYRGRLRNEDTVAAYDQLAAALKPLSVTPLFRLEDGRHAILLIPGLPDSRTGNPRTNLIFLILTLLSVWITGGFISLNILPSGFGPAVLALLAAGWPFALSMFAILAAHEFGHYLVGRAHGAAVSLPYFLPLPYPISPFGTMGAFINMKAPPKNRRDLLDIGIAGPLAGLIVTIPVLIIGLSLSSINPLPAATQAANNGPVAQLEGSSILYLLTKFAVFGRLLPEPASYMGMPPVLYWARYLLTSSPLPYGGMDVNLHPVAWAGWGGLLITSMNLIPAGQLDGGHLLYVLLGRKRARALLPVILIALAILGFFWSGWWLWAGLIFLLGRAYAEPLDQITVLDTRRKWLAALGLVVFLLVFTPVPLTLMF